MSVVSDPPQVTSDFVFATCAMDSNAWLKRDVARLHPELRLAFSRPGFVSWKGERLGGDFALKSPVAHISGWGRGHATELEQLGAKAIGLLTSLRAASIHVYAAAAQCTPLEVEALATDLQAWLRGRGFELPINARVAPGQCIIDVVVVQPTQWFVGWHTQREEQSSRVGGVVAGVLADEASPSRAYSKVAELLLLGDLSIRPGNVVVELGAAPGGGTLFLLQQGARVCAIDPAPLAPTVVEFGATHAGALTSLGLPAADVKRAQLPKRVDYLVSDVNLAPTVSLRYLERLCALISGPKRGVLVNIKVNDHKAEATLASVLDRARALGQRVGLSQMRVAQLPSHRREIGLVLRRADAT